MKSALAVCSGVDGNGLRIEGTDTRPRLRLVYDSPQQREGVSRTRREVDVQRRSGGNPTRVFLGETGAYVVTNGRGTKIQVGTEEHSFPRAWVGDTEMPLSAHVMLRVTRESRGASLNVLVAKVRCAVARCGCRCVVHPDGHHEVHRVHHEPYHRVGTDRLAILHLG